MPALANNRMIIRNPKALKSNRVWNGLCRFGRGMVSCVAGRGHIYKLYTEFDVDISVDRFILNNMDCVTRQARMHF